MPNVSPVSDTIVFTMRVDQGFLDAVDELRRLQTPIPSKSSVIREAVMEALHRAKAMSKPVISPRERRATT